MQSVHLFYLEDFVMTNDKVFDYKFYFLPVMRNNRYAMKWRHTVICDEERGLAMKKTRYAFRKSSVFDCTII